MTQEELFIDVLEKHKGILYKIAQMYAKNDDDKNDLIQEITFQLWKSFKSYDSRFQYSTWIYRIALNVAISTYRKNKKFTANQPLTESIFNIQQTDIANENEQQLQLLQNFIQELNNLDKALILLYLEEKSHKEISEIMGISTSNVGTKINRIKKILKTKFDSYHA